MAKGSKKPRAPIEPHDYWLRSSGQTSSGQPTPREQLGPSVTSPTTTKRNPTASPAASSSRTVSQPLDRTAQGEEDTPMDDLALKAKQLEALRLELELEQQRIIQERLNLENERQTFEDERHTRCHSMEGNYEPPPVIETQGPTKSLRELSAPRIEDVDGPVVLRGIAANNMQINPAHVALVQQSPFYGLEQEDPHSHLQTFLDCT